MLVVSYDFCFLLSLTARWHASKRLKCLSDFRTPDMYQYTALSSRAVDRHQMYSTGLVVGTLTIDPGILATPPLIFTGESKSAKLDVVFDITQL